MKMNRLGPAKINRVESKAIIVFASLLLALILLTKSASAQTLTIQLSAHSVSFVDSTPLAEQDVPAMENPITAAVNYTGKGVVHIFMIANGNMVSNDGKVTIPIDQVYWTGTGTGYESGKLSLSQQVEASSGPLSHEPGAGWHFYLKHRIYQSGGFHLSITVIATVQ